MKAPNGEKSNLNEKQWAYARTEEFKNKFGDWESAANYKLIDKIEPIQVEDEPPANVREIYSNLGNGKNKYDGSEVEFVNETLGKIIYHKGFNIQKLVPVLKEVFDNSFLWDSTWKENKL